MKGAMGINRQRLLCTIMRSTDSTVKDSLQIMGVWENILLPLPVSRHIGSENVCPLGRRQKNKKRASATHTGRVITKVPSHPHPPHSSAGFPMGNWSGGKMWEGSVFYNEAKDKEMISEMRRTPMGG